MPSLKQRIQRQLSNAKKIAFLGIGSELRGDDVAGILVAEELQKRLPALRSRYTSKVFIGATTPENLTGALRKFHPTHIVLIDSADFGKRAGCVDLLDAQHAQGVSFCTHNLPVNIFLDYLSSSLGCGVIIIGIQPKKLDFNSQPSKEVVTAARRVSTVIISVLREK